MMVKEKLGSLLSVGSKRFFLTQTASPPPLLAALLPPLYLSPFRQKYQFSKQTAESVPEGPGEGREQTPGRGV